MSRATRGRKVPSGAMQGFFFCLENRTVEYQFSDADFAALRGNQRGRGDNLRSEIALLRC